MGPCMHVQAPAEAPPADPGGAAGDAAAVATPAAEGAPRRQWDDDGVGDGPRPQDAFRVPVDNADAPFRPRADHWPGFQARPGPFQCFKCVGHDWNQRASTCGRGLVVLSESCTSLALGASASQA